jgi:hypothetical protein
VYLGSWENTSAIGWLFKTMGVCQDSLYYKTVRMILRKVTKLMLETSHCLYSQHIQGAQNTAVPDMLSSFEGMDPEELNPFVP